MAESLAARIRAAISDSYYDARNDGLTMEHAADTATAEVMAILDEHPRGMNREQMIAKVAEVLYGDVEAVDPDERAELPPAVVDAILPQVMAILDEHPRGVERVVPKESKWEDPGYRINVLLVHEALRRAEEAEAEVKRLRAQAAAVSAAAFDPDTVSALERGAVGTPPSVDGVTVEEALSYAYDALCDIRAALGHAS